MVLGYNAIFILRCIRYPSLFSW